MLHRGGTVDSVGLNYLEKNLAPVVDDVVVQPGARVAGGATPQQNTTVQVAFLSRLRGCKASCRIRTRSADGAEG